jgi:uncharacterized protein HemX
MILAAPTADAVLSSNTALILGIASACATILIAFIQSRVSKSNNDKATEAWREQADELSERLERQNAAEIRRFVATIEDKDRQLKERDRVIRDRDRELDRLRRKSLGSGDNDR